MVVGTVMEWREAPPTIHFHPVKNATDGTSASRCSVVPRNVRPGQRPIRRPKKSPDRQQTDYNPQVAHPIINPIILQVPNREANSGKSIRPVQGTFSGLQNAPDSD